MWQDVVILRGLRLRGSHLSNNLLAFSKPEQLHNGNTLNFKIMTALVVFNTYNLCLAKVLTEKCMCLLKMSVQVELWYRLHVDHHQDSESSLY